MPREVIDVQDRNVANEREIRRLRARLDYLTTGDGLRAIRIVGLIPPANLPDAAGGDLLVYVSFGSEPTGGQTYVSTVMYSGDLVVQT